MYIQTKHSDKEINQKKEGRRGEGGGRRRGRRRGKEERGRGEEGERKRGGGIKVLGCNCYLYVKEKFDKHPIFKQKHEVHEQLTAMLIELHL